ncbi:Hypothetical predicted protein, partial [Paramuricea clavata]
MEGFTLESLLLEVLDKLGPKQFSLPKKSTSQVLVYLMHQIHAGLYKGPCSARVFFTDFKKGFDLVDLMNQARCSFYTDFVNNNSSDQGKLFRAEKSCLFLKTKINR